MHNCGKTNYFYFFKYFFLSSVSSCCAAAAPAECGGGPEPAAQVRAGAVRIPPTHHLLVQGRHPPSQLTHSQHPQQKVSVKLTTFRPAGSLSKL